MRPGRLEVLSEAEVASIHEASLRILAETGVEVGSEGAVGVFAGTGCRVDGRRVRFPPRVVRRALQAVPRRIPLCDRRGRRAHVLGEGGPLLASGHNAIYVCDPPGLDRHPATKEEVERFARLADALPNIDVVGVQAMPQDVPPRASLAHAMHALWRGTAKHAYFSPDNAVLTRGILDMMRVVAGSEDLASRPIATCQLSPTSPLRWEPGAAEAALAVARAGVPLAILPEPFCGATGPYTLAGILALHGAELLSGVVLCQAARPGAPVIYGGAWTSFDMRTGNVVIGSPETALLRIAGAQLARFYGMPSHAIGPDTDAHAHDEQMAWEKTWTSLAAALGGVDLIVNAGMYATGLSVGFAQLVVDEEIFAGLRRVLAGIRVDEETLAVDAIARAGPGGDFLTDEHTLRHLGGPEHWEPAISVRERFEGWRRKGAEDAVARAAARARRLLESRGSEPLDASVERGIEAILDRLEREGT